MMLIINFPQISDGVFPKFGKFLKEDVIHVSTDEFVHLIP